MTTKTQSTLVELETEYQRRLDCAGFSLDELNEAKNAYLDGLRRAHQAAIEEGDFEAKNALGAVITAVHDS